MTVRLMSTETQHFTIIEVDEWALLFVDGDLISQGHRIRLPDLVEVSAKKPFTLEVFAADGTALEEYLLEYGSANPDMTLSKARTLAEKKK